MSSGTVYLVMGAPGAGTCTVMERVRDALTDSPEFNFPRMVATGPSKYKTAEVVSPDEFQRRKVSGELQLFWTSGGVELAYPGFIRTIEAGVNVAIEISQSVIPKVEKLFFYHKKRIVYLTASEEVRKQRMIAAERDFDHTCQVKPQGPSVCTVVNSGTITEAAADVIAGMKQHGRETIAYPSSAVTLTVLRNAKNETRDYLSEQVIPGLTTALTAISALAVKPRNPYLWLAQYLESNANLAGGLISSKQADVGALLPPGSFMCRLESTPHVMDEPSRLIGVSNLRRSAHHECVLGVHQPSTKAIRELVADLCGTHGRVVWVCVRDTPVVYVNGLPHVLESKEHHGEAPSSIKTQCISGAMQLKQLEREIARELSSQASTQGGNLQLFPASRDKDAANEEPEPVAVKHDGVQTMQDVFDELEAEGFDVTLRRALLTEQAVPEPEELDLIISSIRAEPQSALLFSCSTGTERTELAMIVAALMLGVDAQAKPRGYLDPLELDAPRDLQDKAQYRGILELCQHLDDGAVVKAVLDDVLDDHSKLMHFRKDIYSSSQCSNDADCAEKSKAVCLAMSKLETYWTLIALTAYLRQQVRDKFQQDFSTWMRSKRGIRRGLSKLCLV